MNKKKLTYISLFSSAGVGCFGFKLENFECIATNEIVKRRLDIQKFNNKCKYNTGYIDGDITFGNTQEKLFAEVNMWKKKEKLSNVDVIIATPPCQGMSVANHKKNSKEIIRNSLVIESIKIIKKLKPRIFIFENVPSFMKTTCTDIDGNDKSISEAIRDNFSSMYSYSNKIINFKEYGACSSRSRTLVIGVLNEISDWISPLELFPDLVPEVTLKDVIGSMESLSTFSEISSKDIYHAFRRYPEHMRRWITNLKEGQSAFENEDDENKPHQIIDGKLVVNKQKNGDKYRRQIWDKVGPCIHTRNDQLASQNTIHPSDDRVFSIRELMLMMTVPKTFKWVEKDYNDINNMSNSEKITFLKKEEIKIRQSLGEAVPTVIFRAIANKIKIFSNYNYLKPKEIKEIVNCNNFSKTEKLIAFIKDNPNNLAMSSLSRIAELSNSLRTDNAAFFTNKSIVTEMMKNLPDTEKQEVRILEPSVGVGNFIPLILKKFEGKKIILDVVDIDNNSIAILKALLGSYKVPSNCHINYITDDFLLHDFNNKYDYVIGNPPFYKMKTQNPLLKKYRENAINKATTNICSYFMDKSIELGEYVSLVYPKFILNTPEFKATRDYLEKKSIDCIIDYGEKGFSGVLIETIAILINNKTKPKHTKIISITKSINLIQKQKYIFDNKLPYWVIYRNELFDNVLNKLKLNVFKVFRDRQITKKMLKKNGEIRVIKSRNISDDGRKIIDIPEYDSYISKEQLVNLAAYKYLSNEEVYLTPNMTYKPRVMKKPKNIVLNGSVAILIPKNNIKPKEKQLLYFSSDEYRQFYQIARNYQTRSLNVDSNSVYFFGLLKIEDEIVSKPKTTQINKLYLSDYDMNRKEDSNNVDTAINY